MSNFRTVKEFEERLKGAYWLATANSTIHKLRNALSVGALSWAALSLLQGGLTSNIPVSEHVLVSKLAALIICLRAFAPLFSNLLTRRLKYTGSIDPQNLSYDDQQVSWVMGVQFVAFVCEAGVLVLSATEVWERMARADLKHLSVREFLLSYIANSAIHAQQSSGLNPENLFNESCLFVSRITSGSEGNLTSICFTSLTGSNLLRVSVLIYMRFVSWTCFAAIGLWIVFVIVWSCLDNEQRKYHDEVMRRGMADSVWRADEFDKIEFFLDSMGDDLAVRNIGALEVRRQNSEFLDYLYHHPTGVERVLLGLTSSSVVRQQTAANIVGFWAKKSDLKKKQSVLLSKLAEKLGLPGKTAEAAANSFYALANEWSKERASPLLEIQVAKGDAAMATCNVVEKVVDLVLGRRLPTLQVYVRTLDGFFKYTSVLKWLTSPERKSRREEIKGMLWQIAQRLPDPAETSSVRAVGDLPSDPDQAQMIAEKENALSEDLLKDALHRLLRCVEWLRLMVRKSVHGSVWVVFCLVRTLMWVFRLPFCGIAWLWRWARRKIRGDSAKDGLQPLLPIVSSMNDNAKTTNIRTRTAFLALSAWVRLSDALSNDEKSQLKEKLNHIDSILTVLNNSSEIKEVLWWDEEMRFRELWKTYFKGTEPPQHSWINNCTKRGLRYKQA